MRYLTTSLFGAAILCMGAVASAQQQGQRLNREQLLEKYDKNKNGRIDADEREAIAADFAAQRQNAPQGQRGPGGPGRGGRGGFNFQEVLDKYDANKNGRLDDDEREKMMADRQAERKKEFLDKYDSNKDGKLDDKERDSMIATLEKERRDRFDRDNDGKLNEDEAIAYAASLQGGGFGGRGGFGGGRGGFGGGRGGFGGGRGPRGGGDGNRPQRPQRPGDSNN